jgi:hypothetical protein
VSQDVLWRWAGRLTHPPFAGSRSCLTNPRDGGCGCQRGRYVERDLRRACMAAAHAAWILKEAEAATASFFFATALTTRGSRLGRAPRASSYGPSSLGCSGGSPNDRPHRRFPTHQHLHECDRQDSRVRPSLVHGPLAAQASPRRRRSAARVGRTRKPVLAGLTRRPTPEQAR